MRGLRSTLALLAVLIGLGGYIYFVSSKPSGSDDARDKLFDSLEAGKVQELKVKSESGEVTALRKEGGAWTITSPIAVPAAEGDATGIANALADIAVTRVVEENPTDVKAFGLEPARIEVEFKTEDGKSGRLFIGDKTATGGNLYVRRDDEKRLLLIPQYHESALNRNTFDLRDKTIVKFDRTKVDRVEVELAGGGPAFTKTGSDWTMTRPVAARADYSAVEGLIGHVESAQMKRVVSAAPTPAELKTYGFDKPQATINLHLGSATATLVIGGKSDDTSVYARDSARPDVFTIDSAAAADFNKPADDYRKKELFDFRAFNATRVEISRGGQAVVFERVKAKDDKSPDTWRRVSPNPGDPDREKVEALLAGMADIRATSFVASKAKTGLDAPAMTVVAKFDEGKKEERVTFGKVGTDVFASRPDDPGAARVEAGKFDDTVKALDELSK
jgi:hypothetical protein